MPPSLNYENRLKKKGFKNIAGIDEAGRGPLAGPVVAAAVILPEKFSLPGLDDSKKLSEDFREELYQRITSLAAVGIGVVEAAEIDRLNIFQATFKAMAQAVLQLPRKPDCLLVDGPHKILALELPQWSLVKGDGLSFSVAAASVVAKVTRDRIMRELAKTYPEYSFDENKGYGTKLHLEVIFTKGLTPHHRRSFCVKKQLTFFDV
jgi:ribonuclease HII